MLHALVSTVNKDSADVIRRVIQETGQFTLDGMFFPHASPNELRRSLNTCRLDIVLMDLTYGGPAASLVEQIRTTDASLPIVGFSMQRSSIEPPLGLAGLLDQPFSARNMVTTVRQAIRNVGRTNYPNVTAILPAKAGGGASTIAINVAHHLSVSFGKKVLVVECDLQSGTIGERVGSRPHRSISETLASADVAPTLIWPQHVYHKDGVDFLITSRGPQMQAPAWHEFSHLLDFAAAKYDHIVLDLPDVFNDATSEALHAASSIYIMTTPELLSLRLVSQRIADLEAVQAERSRVRILVNRWQSGDLSPAEIAQMLDCRVAAAFPNDYRAVNVATLNQSFVDPSTRLGKAYRSFAAALAGEPVPIQPIPRFESFLKPFRFSRPAVFGNPNELSSQGRYVR